MREEKIKVVLDANVWISALHERGLCLKILLALQSGEFNHITSMDILWVILKALRRYFGYSNGDAYRIRSTIRELSTVILPRFPIIGGVEICRDPEDNRLIECALWGDADYIVTWDKDLLVLGEYHGIKIINPPDFWDILQERGG